MREFLKGLDLDEETINTIMAEHGKLVTKDKEEITNLKKQVDDANNEIKPYKEMDIEGIKKSASDWETKYNDLVNSQKEEKEKSIKEERVNAFFNGVEFSSESAKAGVINEFNKKDFKYDEDSKKYQGASEWLEEYKKKDAGAFKSTVANPKYTAGINTPKEDSSLDEIKKAMGLIKEEKNRK